MLAPLHKSWIRTWEPSISSYICILLSLIKTFLTKVLLFAVQPLPCSNSCSCHYLFEEDANVLNCSKTNLTTLTDLQMPNKTMWLIAKSNNMSHLQWSDNLNKIQHFDFQNSSIQNITKDFFTKIQIYKSAKFLNLADNELKSFPKSFNSTYFSEVYLAGNPIGCNCDMMWFANWLNRTEPDSQTRVVKDYDGVICEGGRWDGTPVYMLNATHMGCYPKSVPR